MRPWEILKSRYLLEREWMNVREDRIRLPDGRELEEFHVIEYPDWSCIYCTTESGEAVLVEQYRHGIGRFSLELPAGEICKGETPLEAAQRELLEETGYEATEWTFLGRCAPNPSKQTSHAHLFLARGARLVGCQNLDDTEEITVRLLDPAKLLELTHSGEITHGIHVAAILWASSRGLLG